MKKITILFFSLFMLFFATYSHAAKKAAVLRKVINVIVDGESVTGVNIYKISSRTNYFSVKEVAKIYNATLEWKPVSSRVTMYLNGKKIDIKADSTEVVFNKKSKRMSLPSRLIRREIYISPEILKSKEFAEIAEADTEWNPSSLVLNVTHRTNISAVRYFTRPESTQVLIQLEEPLSYTVSKAAKSIILKILRGQVQRDFLSVKNGVIRDIVYDTEGRYAIIKINLQQIPKLVKTSMLSKPDRISVDIVHSKKIDILGKDTVTPAREEERVAPNDSLKEIDLTPPEKYGQSQISEIISVIKNDENNKDLEKVPVAKFESKNIIDDSFTIVDDTAPIVDIVSSNHENKKKSYCERKRVIVLDAGHGGQDPGAIGPNGTKEKDINLEIVYELKAIFDRDDNYEVILTRKDDTFIPLAERTNIANQCNADLFISVHCNATFDRNVNGFEIYSLSEKATDSEAAATALLENSVLELEKKSSKQYTPLQNVMWSMAVTEYINESSELGGFISAETTNRLKIPNKGVKQASFYVLRGSQMPAVLVESAFISNYAQEAKFSSKKFRAAVADSVYEGVVKYYASKDKKQNSK